MNGWWRQERYFISKKNAYFITLMLIVLFSIIRIWPLHILGSYNPYLTYYPAIIIAAVIGGFFAGLLATAITCVIVSLLWWLVVNEPFIKVPSDWLAMALFAFNGTLISSIAESMRRANERAQSERKQLEFSLNVAQLGSWDLNLGTGEAKHSLLHAQIFGYSSPLSAWSYEQFLSHVHPDDVRFVDEAVKAARASHKPWEFQCRIYRADDKSIRWIWVSGGQIKLGKNHHMQGLVQDITQRKNDELALHRMTSKMNALLEATPDCLIITNKEGQIIFANAVAEKIFGYTAEKLIRQKIEFLLPARYQKHHIKNRQHYFEKPKLRPMGQGLELFGQHKDGHEFPVEISLSPIETEEGLLVLAAVRDITDRKKTELSLLQYAAIIESTDDAILSKNLEGIITSWNGGAERIFGYTREEVMGQPILMLIPEEYQHEEIFMLEKVCRGEKVDQYETVYRHEDGKLLDISLTLSPICDLEGGIIGASMVARDITKHKQAENALKVSELRFRTMAEAMPQVVWITRADGWNIYFNQQWVDYTGLTLEESYGHGWNKPFHPDDQQRAWDAWQQAVHNNGKYSLECRLRRKDGIYRWWLVRGVPLHDEHGKIIQWFGTCTDINDINDINDIKAVEQELRIAAATFETYEAIMITDADISIIKVNKAFTRITGFCPEEVLGKNPRIMKSGRHDKSFYVEMFLKLQRDGTWKGEIWDKRKNDEIYPLWMVITVIKDAQHKIVQYVSIFSDITERKKTEDAKAMLLALVESSDEAIIGKDLQGIIFSWNKSAEDLYGYTEAEMKGSSIKKLFPEDKQDEFDMILHMIKRGEHIKHKETVRIHKDGHMIPVSVTISPINDVQGKVIGASTTARDITQQKLFEEKLKHLAEHDPLTGLINRPLFEDRIEQALLLSKRQKNTMAVCFLDIDDFKHINDQYGHATGDLLLCAATERLQTCIRDSDTLARLGGDEFALILLNLKKEEDVVKIAKKMIKRFSAAFLIENITLKVTLSIGISLYPRDGHQSLIQKADSAMYYVKNHGKNNFKLFDTSVQLGRK